jgi:2-phospho-L-lactate/phosphoenolpyruvate guanylyltransferase
VRTAAILPVKSFARAKQRLGQSIEDPLRLALARAMVADVLAALMQIEGVTQTIVVTRQQDVAQAALASGAVVVEDAGEQGQSAAVTLGVAHALAARFERVLCVPGDCPALDPAEIEALLSEHRRDEVIVLPDRHGTGTNGLLLAPPDRIAPSFGADSCERHKAAAVAAGMHCRVQALASLSLDVDTGADLQELRRALSASGQRAANTRAVLSTEPVTASVPSAA